MCLCVCSDSVKLYTAGFLVLDNICMYVHVGGVYHMCLYEGRVFLCTDRKAPGRSVFAIS